MADTDSKIRVHHLIRQTVAAFYWLDESLQNLLVEHGWPRQSHAQSMVVLALGENINRPADIARRLGISRQAVHQMLAIMAERGLVTMIPDPSDGRAKIVKFSKQAEETRRQANQFVSRIEDVLRHRLGDATYDALVEGLNREWGAPLQTSADLDIETRAPEEAVS